MEVFTDYISASCESKALELRGLCIGVVSCRPGILFVQHGIDPGVAFLKCVTCHPKEGLIHIGAAITTLHLWDFDQCIAVYQVQDH